VLSTEVFDEFMSCNDLYSIASSNITDEKIVAKFVSARLPEAISEDLRIVVQQAANPMAIRSSSKLEDSYYLPFAGIYNTYMIPLTADRNIMHNMLENAIKCVYASVFFRTSKAYALATSNIIDEEKMGIIIQEVCGEQFGNIFYPAVSGIARSINFYPVAPEKSTDGIATIAFGLGKILAEGGNALRFSPKYPARILQLADTDMAVKSTQKYFYALDMNPDAFKASPDDRINLRKCNISDAEDNPALRHASSTYDYENNIIVDYTNHPGRKIITFSNILINNSIPLAEIIDHLLYLGQKSMNIPVEIEFAVNTGKSLTLSNVSFNFLQIRPVVISEQNITLKIKPDVSDKLIVYSEKALGNGLFRNVKSFIYVKPHKHSLRENLKIASEISRINDIFLSKKKTYVLAGPGRWGSGDPWLGIPVKWAQISAARVIIEYGMEDYRIEPSQGTHFFHNLTSFGVGYLTVNPFINDGILNIEYLNSLPSSFENAFIRQVDFDIALGIEIDGRNNKAVIYEH